MRIPTNGILLGMMLAVANTILIAVGIAATESGNPFDTIVMVCLFGGAPALFAGVLVGGFAELTKSRSVWLRRLCLFLPCVACVCVLGLALEQVHFIGVACLPTAAAVMILEQRTRFVAEPEVAPAVVC